MKWKMCLGLLAVLVFMSSCTEDIDLKLNNTKPLFVVDGRITTDITTHSVRLTMTADYYSNEMVPAVSAAKVSLDDGMQTIVLHESDAKPGYYETPSDYFGVVGRTYKLIIENVDADKDGHTEVYEAVSILNPVNEIDSVDYEYDDQDKMWKVLLYGQDIPDRKDYYMWGVAKNDSLVSDAYSELQSTDDEFFDGNYANRVWVQSIAEEDEDGDLKITVKDGDWIKLIMGGINEEFHNYLMAIQEETGFKSPLFSGPPANVRGNIISNSGNEVLGFFTTYSVVRDSVQVNGKK